MTKILYKILSLVVFLGLMQCFVNVYAYSIDDQKIISNIESLLGSKDHKRILKECNEAIKIIPNQAKLYFWKGLALYNLEDIVAAKIALDKAISLDENFSDAYYVRSTNYIDLEKYDNALADLDKAFRLGVDKCIILSTKSLVLFKANRFEEALREIDQITTVGCEADNLARITQGKSLIQLHKFDEAITTFDKILAINDKNSLAYFNRAIALFELEKYDRALSDLEKASELNYDDEYSIYLIKGKILDKLGKNQEASLSFKEAEKIKKSAPVVLGALANIYIHDNLYVQALKQYDKIIKIDDKNANIYLKKGMLLKKTNRHQEALINFRKAISLDPSLGPIEKYINEKKK